MARLVLVNLDLNGNQILGLRTELLAADPSGGGLYEGRLWINSTSHLLKYYNGSGVVVIGSATGVNSLTVDNSSIENTGTAGDPIIRVKAAGITNAMLAGSIAMAKLAAPIADFDLASHKLINVTDPTSAQDAATKAYVDTFVNGLAPKDNVRAATTANGTLATAYENGDAIDGVTLATGDRILLKNQTAGAENGIYIVAVSGAPTRATDADASAELIGASVFVSEGTTNGNTLWVMTTDSPITVGTTAMVWSQFGGPGAVTAGTGITVTGQSVALTVPVAVANGGTNATTAAGARASLGAATTFAQDVGDNSSTAIVVTHNLGTRDVIVGVHRATTPFDEVICDMEMTSTTTVTLRFASAPTTNQFRVVIVGLG